MKIVANLRSTQAEFVRKAQALQSQANQEERELTEAERATLQSYLDEAKAIQARVAATEADRALFEQLSAMAPAQNTETAQEGRAAASASVPTEREISLGARFVASEGYRGLPSKGARFSTGAVELQAVTLGTGGASNMVAPDRRAMLPILSQRLFLTDLLGSGTTNSTSIIVPTESVLTNAAAAVAEGGTKPLSDITYSNITETVKKLAHVIKVSDESLDDIPYLASLIDGRGRLMLEQVEETQLLSGDGLGANILGLLNRSGLTAAQARGTDTNFDAIHKEITKIALASFLYPDGIVVNPTNWETMELAKDTTGRYIGAGPFEPRQVKTLWGLPVVTTTGITAGTGLVGNFKIGAAVITRSGMSVEMTNSNEDDFRKNLVAMRFEKREALAVYRPSAFGTVTGLN